MGDDVLDLPDYDNLDQYFPFPEMRKCQEVVVPHLREKLQDDHTKVIFCELATGVGKSPLAIMAAEASKSAYILTADKSLQRQYVDDFSAKLIELKGRSNYPCSRHKKRDGTPFNCYDAPCQQSGGPKCTYSCDYHLQLKQAAASKVTLFNFASGYCQLKYNQKYIDGEGRERGYFDKRRLIIIDEAHLIPEYLTGLASINISRREFKKLFEWQPEWGISFGSNKKPKGWIEALPDSEGSFDEWLNFFDALMRQIAIMLDVGMYGNSKEKLESFGWKVDAFLGLVDSMGEEYGAKYEDLFVQYVDDKGINFQPVDIRNLFSFLCTRADKIILMSATFLNTKIYSKMLGLKREEWFHVYSPSPFAVENRIIRVSESVGRLSARGKYEENKVKMLRSIDAIADHYANQKGIIHSPSYSWSEFIYDNVAHSTRVRILFPRNAAEKDFALHEHKTSSKPTILLSPSMREGIDLKGKLSEFQIISKIPWPNKGDPLIVKRDNIYPKYSNLLTLLSLIQSCGRSVRNETDKCTTFILDYFFWMLVNMNSEMVPKDFMRTVRKG